MISLMILLVSIKQRSCGLCVDHVRLCSAGRLMNFSRVDFLENISVIVQADGSAPMTRRNCRLPLRMRPICSIV